VTAHVLEKILHRGKHAGMVRLERWLHRTFQKKTSEVRPTTTTSPDATLPRRDVHTMSSYPNTHPRPGESDPRDGRVRPTLCIAPDGLGSVPQRLPEIAADLLVGDRESSLELAQTFDSNYAF